MGAAGMRICIRTSRVSWYRSKISRLRSETKLTVANGLLAEWLRKQLDVIDGLRDKCAPLQMLAGIEVDILDDDN
ncbi:hypothetical protein A8144_06920 [Mycobacterium leprae 3125609]|nr:hypothetical protein [Mycobacterium leprae]OAR21327.1 hypothetical protein A8144_06920 [Mycobacterium leprae 3125609]OAX71412.1 hypothetical protein A3216_06095 [Mycobacterium leprae 7935681]